MRSVKYLIALALMVLFSTIGIFLYINSKNNNNTNKKPQEQISNEETSTPSTNINLKPIESTQAGLANPASIYCLEQGGKTEIKKDNQNGEFGVCVLTDGAECDEWEFFRTKICK